MSHPFVDHTAWRTSGTHRERRERSPEVFSNVSLTGTYVNCAGGVTPTRFDNDRTIEDQTVARSLPVEWVPIADPNPASGARNAVYAQGAALRPGREGPRGR